MHFTLSQDRKVLQKDIRTAGGCREHRVCGQPQERQKLHKKAKLQLR